MYKTVLVAVDGSPTALKAVEHAASLARAFGSVVGVVYVIDPFPFTGLGSDFAYGQAEYLSAASAEAAQAIDQAQGVLRQAGVDQVQTAVVEAHATWRGILDQAQKVQADLIVLGSHGRHGLEKIMLGSVAQRVLAHAHLPVFVVRA